MTLVTTCVRRSAVAPAALCHCAETSCERKPSVGTNSVTALWMQVVMESAVAKLEEL